MSVATLHSICARHRDTTLALASGSVKGLNCAWVVLGGIFVGGG